MGIFCNGANCDIYIVKESEKKLLNDISNAPRNLIKKLYNCKKIKHYEKTTFI